MAEFRVLTPAYIQDAYRERGEIVDIDPASVLTTDVHLERVKKPHKAAPAPVPEPVAPVAEKVPATKADEEKKAPAKPDVIFEMVPVKHDILDMSTPKAVIVSPDGKETPIAKPAPEKAAADDKKAAAKDDQKDAAPEKPTSGKP